MVDSEYPPLSPLVIIWLEDEVLPDEKTDCAGGGDSLHASRFKLLIVLSQSTRGFVSLSIWSMEDLGITVYIIKSRNSLKGFEIGFLISMEEFLFFCNPK